MHSKPGIACHLEVDMQHSRGVKPVAADDAAKCILKPAKIILSCAGSSGVADKCIYCGLVARQGREAHISTAKTLQEYPRMRCVCREYIDKEAVGP